jgi:hypothetical protein
MSKFYVIGLTQSDAVKRKDMEISLLASKLLIENPSISANELGNALIYASQFNGNYFITDYIKDSLFKYLEPEMTFNVIGQTEEKDIPSNAAIMLKL